MTKTSIALAGLVLSVLLVAGRAPAASGVAPGQAAPSIEFATAEGRPISLASLRGNVVLVDFWASWCGPCAQAFPAVEDLFQDYRTRGFEVLAVNLDEKRRDADRFLADRPHAMTVAFDPQGKSAKAFGLEGMPTSFLIGRDGKVRFVHTGYTQKTLEDYRREIELLLEEARNEP
jgi:cytochrome c biogenesis protein CcmG, thiol:disulfide interchange protein DsbE